MSARATGVLFLKDRYVRILHRGQAGGMSIRRSVATADVSSTSRRTCRSLDAEGELVDHGCARSRAPCTTTSRRRCCSSPRRRGWLVRAPRAPSPPHTHTRRRDGRGATGGLEPGSQSASAASARRRASSRAPALRRARQEPADPHQELPERGDQEAPPPHPSTDCLYPGAPARCCSRAEERITLFDIQQRKAMAE